MNASQHQYVQLFDELPEKSIIDYLKRHPDFFIHHEEVLTEIQLPHAKPPAVSLVDRQLAVLREENRQLQHRLENLVAIAKKNEQLNGKIQHVLMALSGVTEVEEFLDTLYDTLLSEFDIDAAVIRLFGIHNPGITKRAEFVEYDAQIFDLFEELLEKNKPVCGRLSSTQAQYLFPEKKIGSAVLIPLAFPKPQGLLALGSQEISRFHAGMGTDLLHYMGKLISQLFRIWLHH